MTSSTSSSDAEAAPPVRPRPGLVQLALAVLLPALVLALVGWRYARPEAWELSPEAESLEVKLVEEGTPDIVVLGNSLAGMDLDSDMLEERLGGVNAVKLHVNQTRPPTWYAVLKNRVYANGHAPKLVLIVGLLSMVLETDEVGDNSRSVLESQMTPDDAVILEKAFGQGGHPAWQRARRRKTQVRQDVLLGVRDVAIGTFYGDPALPVLERGRTVAEESLNRVFGAEGAIDLGMYRRVIPIVEESYQPTTGRAVDPETSFLPDFAAIAKEHGAKVVFVRVPLPPSNLYFDRRLGSDVEREAVQVMNDHGIGYLDLSQLDIPETGFEDFVHLNKAGRQILTEHLSGILTEWDALGDGPVPKASLPMAPLSAERTGTLPELPQPAFERDPGTTCGWTGDFSELRWLASNQVRLAGLGDLSPVVVLEDGRPLEAIGRRIALGEGCTGRFAHVNDNLFFSPTGDDPDAGGQRRYTVALSPDVPLRSSKGDIEWWVYPGTILRLRMPPVEPTADFSLRVVADVLGDPGDRVPTVRVGDGEPEPFRVAGNRMTASVERPPPKGEWTIELASAPKGPYVVVRTVAVTQGGSPSYVIGTAKAEETPAVRIVGKPSSSPTPAWWDAAPPALVLGEPVAGPGTAAVEAPDLARLSVMRLKRLGKRVCDPIRVYEDDVELAFTACGAVKSRTPGSFCHEGGWITWTSSDGTHPMRSDHVYTVALDPQRSCDKGLWMYPGDTMHVRTTESHFAVGADRLDLRGTLATDPGEQKMHVQLDVRGWLALDTEVPLADFAKGDVLIDLERRIPPTAAHLVLTVSVPADAPWLVLDVASLAEERPFEPLPVGAPFVPGDDKRGVWLLDPDQLPDDVAAMGKPAEIDKVGAPVPRKNGWYGWEVPMFESLEPEKLARAGLEGCWPLQVLEDGQALERARQVGTWVEFRPTGKFEEHTYTLAWSGQRVCGGAVWLYPRETLKLTPTHASPRERVEGGSARLAISGQLMVTDRGYLRIRAGLKPDIVFDEKVDIPTLTGTWWTWPVELGEGPLYRLLVDVANRSPTPVVFREVGLVPE